MRWRQPLIHCPGWEIPAISEAHRLPKGVWLPAVMCSLGLFLIKRHPVDVVKAIHRNGIVGCLEGYSLQLSKRFHYRRRGSGC